MSNHQILYLSQADVAKVNLDMATVIKLLDTAFREKGAGKVEMPPKPGIHTMPDAFIHAMPAFIPALQSAGIKWVSGYPENQKRGLPYITGLLILNDVETGIPYSAARYLARPASKTAGILACGVQGRTNLEALKVLFPIERVYAYDIHPEQQQRYVEEMSTKLNVEVISVKEPKQAVIESDLVVTSGPILKHPTPTIQKDWLQPGAFGSAVDFDSYWTAGALSQMDRISTDDHAQFQYYKSIGYFQTTPDPYADLGEIVAGLKPGRENPKERTLAINLGLAMDDMAVAPEVYRRAKGLGIGTWLTL
jgi:ornithine cyclodeaminase/alanine dehydrogenase